MNVEIHEDPNDGRISVRVGGYVRWCGRDREIAHTIARSLGHDSPEAAEDRRSADDDALPRAVDVMRRVL
jgi:hypothetical protein